MLSRDIPSKCSVSRFCVYLSSLEKCWLSRNPLVLWATIYRVRFSLALIRNAFSQHLWGNCGIGYDCQRAGYGEVTTWLSSGHTGIKETEGWTKQKREHVRQEKMCGKFYSQKQRNTTNTCFANFALNITNKYKSALPFNYSCRFFSRFIIDVFVTFYFSKKCIIQIL